jgi:hypothetical protein
MSESTRTPNGHDCHPTTDNPAGQPKTPQSDGCDTLPTNPEPPLEEPKKCPDPACECPPKPGSGSNCLEDLIGDQATPVAAGDKAKVFKADLEALLAKAKTAASEYNREKYQKLLKQWGEQDEQIAELLRKLDCNLTCWPCVLECLVCPRLYELRYAEQWLYGNDVMIADVHNLNDLLYWHSRNKDFLERRFNRVKTVLAAWEKPAQTIEKALADDAKLISDINKSLGSDPAKVLVDVFFKLVPMHLAIAPPAEDEDTTTAIDKKFTEICKCDDGLPDDCCGPDVGVLSIRQRLIGPQPYLIDPNAYFDLICCLVKQRYAPAKDELSKAEAEYQKTEAKIKRYKALLEDGLKSFEKDAKGAIPGDLDCCDYEKRKDDSSSSQKAR